MHERAKETWRSLLEGGARPIVSVPVMIETFTDLQRKVSHDLAVRWWESLDQVRFLERVECGAADVKAAIKFSARRDLDKLSLVDATSFVLMRKSKLRVAFSFDT